MFLSCKSKTDTWVRSVKNTYGLWANENANIFIIICFDNNSFGIKG